MTVLPDAPPHVLFGLDPLWVSAALLVATYGAIMTERLNRVLVVGIGSGLMSSRTSGPRSAGPTTCCRSGGRSRSARAWAETGR